MIPKLIHQIWLSAEPMPKVMADWRKRWQEFNPDWTAILWTNNTGSFQLKSDWQRGTYIIAPLVLHNLLTKACHLSQRSNIWRYLITYLYGGLYIDTDVEPFKPIDNLVADYPAFTVQRWLPDGVPNIYECAFFGAISKHPWIRQLVCELPICNPAIPLSMGVDYFTRVTKQHAEVTVLPKELVLFQPPDNWREAKRRAEIPKIQDVQEVSTAAAFAKHHWSSSWFPGSFRPIWP